jgi:hypothetical protein
MVRVSGEALLLRAKDIYQWRGRTMGRTIFRARVGVLLLTNERLVFLSSGRTDAWTKIAWGGLGLGPESVAAAATATDVTRTVLGWIHDRFGAPAPGEAVTIGEADLRPDGSLSVPLLRLTEYGVTLRRFSNFLWIAYRPEDESQAREFAFATNVGIPGGRVWEETIRAARDALTSR